MLRSWLCTQLRIHSARLCDLHGRAGGTRPAGRGRAGGRAGGGGSHRPHRGVVVAAASPRGSSVTGGSRTHFAGDGKYASSCSTMLPRPGYGSPAVGGSVVAAGCVLDSVSRCRPCGPARRAGQEPARDSGRCGRRSRAVDGWVGRQPHLCLQRITSLLLFFLPGGLTGEGIGPPVLPVPAPAAPTSGPRDGVNAIDSTPLGLPGPLCAGTRTHARGDAHGSEQNSRALGGRSRSQAATRLLLASWGCTYW